MELMKDGAIMANSGHFNVEVNIEGLRRMATGEPRHVRPFVEEFTLPDGRVLFLLGEGRLINLAAAEGHPASVMDMSFANQSLSAVHIFQHGHELAHAVYSVPESIDQQIAQLKLAAMGVRIDGLTEQQQHYLASWQEGT
jgi:adenosylhomocysteinase